MRAFNAVGIFCDDVREDKGGHTIIGTLPDNMIVNTVPGTLPKLAIYIRIHLDPTAEIRAVSSKLRFPDNSEVPLSSFEAPQIKKLQADAREKGTPYVGIISMAVAALFQIPAAGRILAIAEINGEEIICAALNIEEQPTSSATASAPLASQSLTAS